MPDNPNFPSEFVAAAYFFPVNVLAAVTVTPGNGVLPLACRTIDFIGPERRRESSRPVAQAARHPAPASPAQKSIAKECSMK